MTTNITREPVSFMSGDAKTRIHGFIWRDEACSTPRGVLQIVHGMAEHIERYDEFARFLASHGFIVAGYSHLGHGQSVSSEELWGCLPARGGADILIQDVHRMRSLVTARTSSSLPYFLFGHSMGSFVTRAYITRYARGLAGAIICGTGHIPAATSRAGNIVARAIAKLKGESHRSKLLDSLGAGGYNKSIENPRTELDWLSHDEGNVDAYIADERCGFMFSAGGYATLTSLTGEVCTPESARNIPHSLPLLFIAGADDPVGSMGKGVIQTVEMMQAAGVDDVEVKIYDGMRHEILNEANSVLVFDDVLVWLDAHTKETSA